MAVAYYAASIESGDRHSIEHFDPKNFVSPEKNQIFDICKKYKGSRFKGFQTYEEALNYAENEQPNTPLENYFIPVAPEFKPPFPSLDTKYLSPFKTEIEKNNLASVIAFIDKNPRYLISYNCDGPTILQAGARYNAVHLAVRKDASDVLKFILQTIDSSMFMRRCYPVFKRADVNAKREYLMDLFLNTPDKICCDTPLHLACKNGSLKCLKILLDYVPALKMDQRNKQNQLAQEVQVRDPNLKLQVQELLNSCMYISVERSSDNLNFYINKPILGRKAEELSPLNDKNTDKKITALVGPMSPEKAKNLYESLKSPQKGPIDVKKLRLQDPFRGVEKAARKLCYESAVPIEEFWPFLRDYADFSTESGLDKLNTYLMKVHDEMELAEVMGNLTLGHTEATQMDEESNEAYFDTIKDPVEDVEAFYTPPSSPRPYMSSRIGVQRFFIEGAKSTPIDRDIFSAIDLALAKEKFNIADLEAKYPFLYHWFTVMKNIVK